MTAERSYDEERSTGVNRRKFIAVGGGVSAALLAGCTSGDPSGDDSPDGSDGTDTQEGGAASFRLLVSDAPADIDDFDRLDVTLDSARVFEGGDESEEEGTETETEGTDAEQTETDEDSANGEETATDTVEEDHQQTGDAENGTSTEKGTSTENGTATETEADSEDATETEDSEDGEEDRGFYVLDLDDPTVDLTQVVGDKAVAVFDGELSEGRYQKLELHVADVEGIVDGEEVEVKVPSEKLQLTKPFEVRAGEELDFVFDINVVKRGNQASYNLKPVISQSGVRGKDVEVEEVGDESGEDGADDGADDSEGGNATDDAATETDAEEDSDDGGADAGNETNETAGNESSA